LNPIALIPIGRKQIQSRHITPRLRLFGPGQRVALGRFVNTVTLDCER
jgi:hypothetical protein